MLKLKLWASTLHPVIEFSKYRPSIGESFPLFFFLPPRSVLFFPLSHRPDRTQLRVVLWLALTPPESRSGTRSHKSSSWTAPKHPPVSVQFCVEGSHPNNNNTHIHTLSNTPMLVLSFPPSSVTTFANMCVCVCVVRAYVTIDKKKKKCSEKKTCPLCLKGGTKEKSNSIRVVVKRTFLHSVCTLITGTTTNVGLWTQKEKRESAFASVRATDNSTNNNREREREREIFSLAHTRRDAPDGRVTRMLL